MTRFLIGLDLGQAHDPTAVAVLERIGEHPYTYHLRHLARPALGTTYTNIVAQVRDLLAEPALAEQASLIIDQTGCGRPVFDLFTAIELRPIGVTLHGGDEVTREEYNRFRVPKRDLVAALRVLFDSGRLKIAEDLPLAQTFVAELQAFKVKINLRTAHDSYEAWRESDHDDLVLAVALAAWYGEQAGPPAHEIAVDPEPPPNRSKTRLFGQFAARR